MCAKLTVRSIRVYVLEYRCIHGNYCNMSHEFRFKTDSFAWCYRLQMNLVMQVMAILNDFFGDHFIIFQRLCYSDIIMELYFVSCKGLYIIRSNCRNTHTRTHTHVYLHINQIDHTDNHFHEKYHHIQVVSMYETSVDQQYIYISFELYISAFYGVRYWLIKGSPLFLLAMRWFLVDEDRNHNHIVNNHSNYHLNIIFASLLSWCTDK